MYEELVLVTVDYMMDVKIPAAEGAANRDDDKDTLRKVTKLQFYAKCAMAQRRGPFGRNPDSNDLVNLIVSQLSIGFKSSGVYLENVGVCEVSGQQVFPTLPENPAAATGPAGWTKTAIVVTEGTLYVNLVGFEPALNIASGADLFRLPQDRRQFVAGNVIDIGDVIEKYTRLLARVAKKVPSAIIPLDLSSGTGTCAQLVGSKNLPVGYTAERQAWCYRDIPQMSLVLGAGFQYGFGTNDPWHTESSTVVITGSISPCAFYAKLMQVNGKSPVGQVEAR